MSETAPEPPPASMRAPSLSVPSSRTSPLSWALFVGILAIAAVLRWHSITDRGFFFDELWNLQLAMGHGSAMFGIPLDRLVEQPNVMLPENANPIWQVPAHTTGTTHPPGTYVMLRAWCMVFGDSMLSLRSASAAWSMLGIVLAFFLARHCFGNQAALWAALLLAISPGNIDQAQDARGYTMLQVFLLFTMMALLRMRGRTSAWGHAICVGIGTLLMMYTHYFSAGLCAAIAVSAILMLKGRARWQTVGAIVVAGLVWNISWLRMFREQMSIVAEMVDIYQSDPSETPIVATLLRLIASPFQGLVYDPQPMGNMAIGGGLVLCVLLAARMTRARGNDAKLALFMIGPIVGLIGMIMVIDLARTTRGLEYAKYFVPILPQLCMLIASTVWLQRWLIPALATAALAVFCYTTPTPFKPDLRPQLAYLAQHASRGDVILLPSANPLGRDGQVTYLQLAHALRWPSHRIAIPVGEPPSSLLQSLPREVRWFYLAYSSAHDPETYLPGTRIMDRGPSTGAAVFEVVPFVDATLHPPDVSK